LVRQKLEAKYPDVNFEFPSFGWAEPLDAKQRSLIAAGTPPTMLQGEAFMPEYADAGLLQEVPAWVLEDINPSFILRGSDGKAYALTISTSTFMLFYNKDLMRKAGLDPEKPPATWDEWKEMSRIITEAGKGEFWGGGIPSWPNNGGSFRNTPFFRQLGTDFAVNGKVNLNDPKLQQVLQFMREMNAYFPPGLGNSNIGEDPLWNAFDGGPDGQHIIAFVVDGTWRGNSAKNMDLGIAPLPLPPGGVYGNCLVGSVFAGLSKGASKEQADIYWDWCKNILLSDELQKLQIYEGGRIVARQSILQDASNFAGTGYMNSDLSAVRQAREDVLAGSYTGLVSFTKNSNEIWEIINSQVLQRTTMTNDPISTICSQAQARIDALLK
jgi:multiple sugar transport system substrate-binding protein